MLAARWKAAEGDHAGAVVVLEDAAKRLPGALGVRVALSHIHIATASPPEVLEPAFRSILELDPTTTKPKGTWSALPQDRPLGRGGDRRHWADPTRRTAPCDGQVVAVHVNLGKSREFGPSPRPELNQHQEITATSELPSCAR
jgi:hypothetical protein